MCNISKIPLKNSFFRNYAYLLFNVPLGEVAQESQMKSESCD